jgi:hypothetical protein
MPKVPMPDECELQETRFARILEQPDVHPRMREYFQAVIHVCPSHIAYVDGADG